MRQSTGESHTKQEEGWEKGSRDFLKQFVSCSQKDPDCEGCRADLDAVMAHVRTQRTAAKKEGYEAGYELRDKEYAKTLKGVEKTIRKELIVELLGKLEEMKKPIDDILGKDSVTGIGSIASNQVIEEIRKRFTSYLERE